MPVLDSAGTDHMAASENSRCSAQWAARSTEGALAGVRVLDLSRVLAGPYLTMMLGDLGAEVIKVERPDGDDTRAWGPPFHDGEATYFLSVNRNKRSVVADLATANDRQAVLELAATAHVVVENFRPGVADRLGVGYEVVRKLNPAVVYCSINAFGDAAQAHALPGYDLLVQAVGGLMSVTGSPESGPMKAGVAVVDVLAGLHACVGVLAALRHADRTGEGQRVNVSLLGTVLASMVNQSSAFLCTGDVPGLLGNAHPSLAPYGTYKAADGEVVIAVGNDGQFRALSQALGRAELALDARFISNALRVEHREELREELEELLADMTVEAASSRLLRASVPAGPVNDLAGAFRYANDVGMHAVVDIGGPEGSVLSPASPIGLSRTPVSYRQRPPRLGSDRVD